EPLEPPSGEADTMNVNLHPSIDFCQYQQMAPSVPSEEPGGDDWVYDGTPYPMCTHGLLHLSASRVEGQAGISRRFRVQASLYEVSSPQAGWTHGTVLDPLEGLDDCGLVEVTTGLGLDSDDAGLAWLDAGAITLSTEDWSEQ